MAEKYTSYEGGTRVPFLVRWPGKVPQGTVSKALVSQIDFLATMGDLLQIDIPQDQAIDSKGYCDAWLGKDLEHGRDFILEATNNRRVSVRTKDWKYIPTGELYQMSEPETKNVAAEHPDQVKALKKLIADEAARTTK